MTTEVLKWERERPTSPGRYLIITAHGWGRPDFVTITQAPPEGSGHLWVTSIDFPPHIRSIANEIFDQAYWYGPVPKPPTE